MIGMLSHDNIHRQQCDQLYFTGKVALVLTSHANLRFGHIYSHKSEKLNPL